jgi:hypothetical protein
LEYGDSSPLLDIGQSSMIDSANPIAFAARNDGAVSERAPLDSSPGSNLGSLHRWPRIHLAWLIVPCLVADGLMVPVFSLLEAAPSVVIPIALGMVGCVIAQGNLLAAWLAWGDAPILRRLLTHWKIAAGLYLIWLVGFGMALGWNGIPPLIAATVALGVPLVSLGAQFPLWLARQLFGWRLVREHADVAPTGERPLTIRDLMLGTVVVAATLALARLAPSPDGKDLWIPWGVAVTVASVISSIALLPAGPLLLRSRTLSRGLYWSGLYAGAWIALPWILVAVLRFYGSVRLPPWQLFVGLSSLMLTFAATLTLTAAIARDRGYRLAGRRVPFPAGRGPG